MSISALSPPPLTRTALRLAPGAAYVAIASVAVLGLALAQPGGVPALALLAIAATLAAVAGLVRWIAGRQAAAEGDANAQIAEIAPLLPLICSPAGSAPCVIDQLR